MPNLGDFLGQLMSEITLARAHADAEALRVAELYASHPQLRHLPVPRVRLPKVDLEFAVAVEEVQEVAEQAAPRGDLDLNKVRPAFERVLVSHLRDAGIRVSRAARTSLRRELDESLSILAGQTDVSSRVTEIVENLEQVVVSSVQRPAPGWHPKLDGPQIDQFRAALRRSARAAILELRQPPPRLRVLVTASELREAGPSELLPRLRLSVSEEALEWHSVEVDGELKDRLTLE